MIYEKLTIDDVHLGAMELAGASKGLQNLIRDRISSTEGVSHDDLSIVDGMTAAIVALAEKHETQMYQLENDG